MIGFLRSVTRSLVFTVFMVPSSGPNVEWIAHWVNHCSPEDMHRVFLEEPVV